MVKIEIQKELYGAKGKMELDVKLQVKEGEFLAITGESGAGKSTLLRIIAGLEKAKVNLEVNNKSWNKLSVQKREIGFLFQDYGLFENMSIEKNLLYVNNDKKLADELLEITELTQLKNRLPKTLSGGQKQRVALCRAFMSRPKLLLLDEPLSALNPIMRSKLQYEILTLHKKFATTTIMVSHDSSEIYRMSSRVIVLDFGKIVKDGTAKEIFKSQSSFIEGEVLEIKHNSIILLIGEQLIELSHTHTQDVKVGEKIKLKSSLLHL